MSVAIFTQRIVAGLFITIGSLLAAGTVAAQSQYSCEGGSGISGHARFYSGGGSYGYHSSTAAEGYLRGRAAVIDALGNFAVLDSQAAILQQQARALDRENDLKQTEALLTQKKMWADARSQARKDRESRAAEGRKLLAERRATAYRDVYQLPADVLNLKTGEIRWPAVLQDVRFQANRDRLDELFRTHVGYGVPRANLATQISRSIDELARVLRSEAGSMSREEYVAAQKFLMGLKYGAAVRTEAA
jgi:hypothetical protein